MTDILTGLEYARETCGTQNTQGYRYSDNMETLAIKEAIEFIVANMEIYKNWKSKLR